VISKINRNSNFCFPTLLLNVEPIVDDTTLRDGVQMPGIAISPERTAKIAYLLDEVGIERIEIHHFQRQDQKAIKLIKKMGLNARIAGWCRALVDDINNAIKCDLNEIGISHPVSYIHFKAKWPNFTEEALLNRVIEAVEYAAKDHGLRVFVHGEDSTRADWEFEKKFINCVSDAGAECYRICDTVGVGLSDPNALLPNGIPAKIKAIKSETKMECIEIHAHDDFGNAVENTLAAIRAASGVWDKVYASTTFLGIGERSGNAETEKVIMNLCLHHGIKKFYGKTSKFKQIADYIGSSTGYRVPPNKAIVGDYAFAHESGIHAHGVLSNPETYEPFPPEIVGNKRRLTIGKLSGKAAIKHKIMELTGKEPTTDKLDIISLKIKELYETGRKASLKEEEFRKIFESNT
jgi:isopropylmalate/homocitrate/citramalate synthase